MNESHFVIWVRNHQSAGCHFAKQSWSGRGSGFGFLRLVFFLFFVAWWRIIFIDRRLLIFFFFALQLIRKLKRLYPSPRLARIEDRLAGQCDLHCKCFEGSERSIAWSQSADMGRDGFQNVPAQSVAG